MNDYDIKNLPNEITETIYLGWSQEYGWTQTFRKPECIGGYILISEPAEVTFKIKPSEDAINNAVSELRDKIQEIRAKSEAQCNAIEEKIQSYLALPNLGE